MSGDSYWDVPIEVQCPYCGERVEISIAVDQNGSMVQDCEVCCHPWQLTVTHDRHGDPEVRVERTE